MYVYVPWWLSKDRKRTIACDEHVERMQCMRLVTTQVAMIINMVFAVFTTFECLASHGHHRDAL